MKAASTSSAARKVETVGKPAGCKLLRISASVKSDVAGMEPGFVVEKISIRGDFFAVPEEEFEKMEAALEGVLLSGLAVRFEELTAQAGIQRVGITGSGIQTLLEEALHG